jgi:hypothetical protein
MGVEVRKFVCSNCHTIGGHTDDCVLGKPPVLGHAMPSHQQPEINQTHLLLEIRDLLKRLVEQPTRATGE